MRPRIGVLGALSAIALGSAIAGATTSAEAKFIPFDVETKCSMIRSINTFEDFWIQPFAMHAYNHVDDPCHDVAVAQYITLHPKPQPYHHA